MLEYGIKHTFERMKRTKQKKFTHKCISHTIRKVMYGHINLSPLVSSDKKYALGSSKQF